MNESLVQWTLLNNVDYLSEALNFEIASKRGQEITTDYGRIDFIVEDYQKKQLIVELETILNNKNKLEYCFNQILNYKNVSFSDKTEYCILYASETKQKSKRIIDNFGEVNDILVRLYSINEVKNLYINGVSYKSRTMYEFLNFACNWCMELGLVETIKSASNYNRIMDYREDFAEELEDYIKENYEVYDRFTFDYLFRNLLKDGYDHEQAKDIIIHNCALSTLVMQERIYNSYYLKISVNEKYRRNKKRD